MDKKITIVGSEAYWEGLYINGELKYQGHEVTPYAILDSLGIETERLKADYNWLTERGRLPDRLEDVTLE